MVYHTLSYAIVNKLLIKLEDQNIYQHSILASGWGYQIGMAAAKYSCAGCQRVTSRSRTIALLIKHGTGKTCDRGRRDTVQDSTASFGASYVHHLPYYVCSTEEQASWAGRRDCVPHSIFRPQWFASAQGSAKPAKR
jgi:hypothetical protein